VIEDVEVFGAELQAPPFGKVETAEDTGIPIRLSGSDKRAFAQRTELARSWVGEGGWVLF